MRWSGVEDCKRRLREATLVLCRSAEAFNSEVEHAEMEESWVHMGHGGSPPDNSRGVDAWLNPDPSNLAAQHTILNDQARPFYEHRMAA